jgi:crotonobetainyl-CoA:carnitine CoA-transferase CaiB-like acyl-CoA transferase
MVSGPWAARLLGDMGADVIKIEPPHTGDITRRVGPFPQDLPHPEKSGLYLHLNSNKRGVTLDLSTGTGKQIFRQLVQGADVLLENHPPQHLEALGLTYDQLRSLNSRLIMVSISPFGQTGPYRDYVGSELVIFQMGSVGYETPSTDVTDPETQPPLKGPGYQGYFAAGWLAATGALTGLFHREVLPGEGQLIDISEQEAVANMVRPNVTRYSYAGEVPPRVNAGPGGVRFKPCKDGFFVGLGVGLRDSDWKKVCELLGNPEWTTWEIFSTQESRREHVEEADPLIIEWMMDYTKAELFDMVQKAGIGAFPMNTVADVYASEQLAFRGAFQEVEHPLAGTWRLPVPPLLSSDEQPHLYRRAPLLGEHNDEIYCQELGYTREDLVHFRQLGVI